MKILTLSLLFALPAFAASWDSGPYTYDGAGNIAVIGTDNYTYDAIGRLTYATAKTPSFQNNEQQYVYDRYGNMKTVTTISGTTTFRAGFRLDSPSNQLNANGVCLSAIDTCFTGEYDAAGNQLGAIPGDGYYQWDPLNVMTGVNLPTRHDQYLYDANDERIATINVNDGSRFYTLRDASNKVVREVASNGTQWTWKKDYVYRDGPLAAAFAAGESGTGPHVHYHVDHLGTSRLITDGAGYKKATHAYWPFGAEAPGSESDAERLKFTGHERDSGGPGSAGNDLDYMHARYYGPAVSRFLSLDPVTEVERTLREPQRWNRYTYVINNPIRYVDADGRVVTITITRDTYTSDTITSTMSVTSDVKNAGSFEGFALENMHAGESGDKAPIPAGTYSAFAREDHDPHRVELQDVPEFTNVQIHEGNTKKDVIGCFAAGKSRSKDQVGESIKAMEAINQVITNDASGEINVVVVGDNKKDDSSNKDADKKDAKHDKPNQ